MRTHSITPCNFQGKYNCTVYGKHNQEIPYLYNQVTELIRGKGIPARFDLGPQNKISMEPYSKKVSEALKAGLEKLGIKSVCEP